MRKIYAGLAGVVLGLAFHINAQTATIGSFSSIAMPIQSAPPDSIVQVAADSQGLQQVALADLPRGGTFWYVTPGGIAAPFPCPPQDDNAIIYQITDTQFLVDQTGGQVTVTTRRLGSLSTATTTVEAALSAQGDAVVNLINQVQETQLNQDLAAMFSLDVPTPGAGGDSGGGTTNNGYFMAAFDYGTNLWIAQTAVSAGYLTGIGSNTEADIQYEIQSRTNLLQSDWQSEGFILGSETTNWTPLSVAQIGRTDLFIRLKSWADDGSGLPIWWQLQYFGYVGVDPYGNPAGDGWNNLQKFQNGMNPTNFYTPAAPQVNAAFNGGNNLATVSWLPSPRCGDKLSGAN